MKQRTYAHDQANSLIAGAMILPLGALDYLWGGWWLVAAVAVLAFLVGIALTVWSAWQEARP